MTDWVARFFTKVRKQENGGCWLWIGGQHNHGYGVYCVERRKVYAHRWSYEYHKGPIPPGLEIDHLCKVRNCVNPDHLEAVTREVNFSRSSSASALNAKKTHCKYGHPFTDENTRGIPGGRKCRTCEGLKSKSRYIHTPRQLKTHCHKGHLYERPGFCRECAREYGREYQRRRSRGVPTQRQERTHCHKGHPYNEENTWFPLTGKQCKICAREPVRMRRSTAPKVPSRKKEWEALKAAYMYTCLRCGRSEPEIKLTADHVIPLSKGGSDTIDNIQPLCFSCNCSKGDKIIDYRSFNPNNCE